MTKLTLITTALIVISLFGCQHLETADAGDFDTPQVAQEDEAPKSDSGEVPNIVSAESNDDPVMQDASEVAPTDVVETPTPAPVPPPEVVAEPPPAEPPQVTEAATNQATDPRTELPAQQQDAVQLSEPSRAVVESPSSARRPTGPIPDGVLQRLARTCPVLESPQSNSRQLNTVPAGRLLWLEPVSDEWLAVYRKSGRAFISAECFALRVLPKQTNEVARLR